MKEAKAAFPAFAEGSACVVTAAVGSRTLPLLCCAWRLAYGHAMCIPAGYVPKPWKALQDLVRAFHVENRGRRHPRPGISDATRDLLATALARSHPRVTPDKALAAVVATAAVRGVHRVHPQDDYYMRRYALRAGDYYRLLAYQSGGCAICGAKSSGSSACRRLFVDHEHAPNKSDGPVRGLLCLACNTNLGTVEANWSYFRTRVASWPVDVRGAMAYLKEPPAVALPLLRSIAKSQESA